MKHVLVTRPLPGPAYEDILRRNVVTVGDPGLVCRDRSIADATEVIVAADVSGFLSEAVLKQFPSLGLVCKYGVGMDQIDVDGAQALGVTVCNTRGFVEGPTAELALALMLSLGRRVTEADRNLRRGVWASNGLDVFTGISLAGLTLGLVGFGAIGRRVATLGLSLGMSVVYFKPNRLDSTEEARCNVSYRPFADLLRSSDVVSLHCPALPSTFHLIDQAALDIMPPQAFLINTCRGSVVSEVALVNALKTGGIAGAGLDVFEDEPQVHSDLLAMDNVVLTPHIGSATSSARYQMTAMIADQIRAWSQGQLPPSVYRPSALGR